MLVWITQYSNWSVIFPYSCPSIEHHEFSCLSCLIQTQRIIGKAIFNIGRFYASIVTILRIIRHNPIGTSIRTPVPVVNETSTLSQKLVKTNVKKKSIFFFLTVLFSVKVSAISWSSRSVNSQPSRLMLSCRSSPHQGYFFATYYTTFYKERLHLDISLEPSSGQNCQGVYYSWILPMHSMRKKVSRVQAFVVYTL